MVEQVGIVAGGIQAGAFEKLEHAIAKSAVARRLVAQIEQSPVEPAEIMPGAEAFGRSHQRPRAFMMSGGDDDRIRLREPCPERAQEPACSVIREREVRRAMREEEGRLAGHGFEYSR